MKPKKTGCYRSAKNDLLVQQIKACSSGFALAAVVRRNRDLFQSNEAVKALTKQIDVLSSNLKKGDVPKLLTALSKARVSRASVEIQQKLMHKMGKIALQKVGEFSPNQLAPFVCAFSRVRCQGALFSYIYDEVAMSVAAASLSEWEEVHLVAIAHAFMKANHMNADIFNTIGREILMRGEAEIFYDSRQLGNLAAAYGTVDCMLTPRILELIFEKFQCLRANEFGLQAVVDIASAMVLGNLFKVIPPGFCDEMARFAIEKARESRHEDVRSVLLTFTKLPIDAQLRRQLLTTYMPLYHRHSSLMTTTNRSKIDKIYKRFGPLSAPHKTR